MAAIAVGSASNRRFHFFKSSLGNARRSEKQFFLNKPLASRTPSAASYRKSIPNMLMRLHYLQWKVGMVHGRFARSAGGMTQKGAINRNLWRASDHAERRTAVSHPPMQFLG
jgi:hypothetical protein